MLDLSAFVELIHDRRRSIPTGPSLLVALSGIDGSDKGYIAARLVEELRARGLNAANVNADGWLNLPAVRFGGPDPAEHFYQNVFRFDEMFSQLIILLKRDRSIDVEADFAEETASAYRRHRYEFRDIDVIVLEGAYLFKRPYRDLYDLAVWVECSFETALERALARGQEGLPPAETIRAYETIYFPAERIHFDRDDPKGSADLVIVNDPRLETSAGPLPPGTAGP